MRRGVSYSAAVFFNIATQAEQTHTDTMRDKLLQFGVEDPEPNADIVLWGTFESVYFKDYFTKKFDDLIGAADNLLNALKVGALIEELDMKDINECNNVIYDEFGFSFEKLFTLDYLGKEGAEKIARIMDMFRNNSQTIFSGLESLEDYSTGEKTDASGEKSTLNLPKSYVLGFKLTGGDTLYLRPSGTEPKIKFYIMIQENEGTLSEKKKRAMEKSDSMVDLIKEVVEKA